MVYFSNIRYGNCLLISEKKKKKDTKQISYILSYAKYTLWKGYLLRHGWKCLKQHECQISAHHEQQGPGSHVSLKTCGSNIWTDD